MIAVLFILFAYTLGYLFCLHSLPGNITKIDNLKIGLITILIQFIVIYFVDLLGGNIILIYLISIEMLVAILYFFIIKRSIEQLPAILFIFLLLALGIQLSELIFFELLEVSYITQESNIFWICINTIIPIVFSFGISKLLFYLYRRYKLDSTLLESHDNLKLSSLMLSMIIFFFIIEIMRSNNSSIGRSNSLITNSALLMIIITIICAIFIIFWFYRKSALGKLHYEQIINNQLREYLDSLEKLENTQRQFRHDFINIYGSLAGYIEDNDMSGLKNYYYKEIEHINSEQNKNLLN